jgi:hypothetical protein
MGNPASFELGSAESRAAAKGHGGRNSKKSNVDPAAQHSQATEPATIGD